MKFSLHIPLGVVEPEGEFQTPEALREMAIALEKHGASACYVTEHPAPDSGWLHANGHDAPDPYVALSFAAAVTKTLRLHTHILVLPYRNPFLTAKAAATLQGLSGGRLIMGVGAGYQPAEFAALGVEFSQRGKLTDEALETIRLIWAGGAVTRKGIGFDAVSVEPRPAPKPLPTIWVGGNTDKAVERAARSGDGWSPFFAHPNQFETTQRDAIQNITHLKDKIILLRELKAKLGKSEDFDVCISPLVGFKDYSPAETRRYLDAVGELADIGVNWVTSDIPHSSRAAYFEGLQWFGEEIIAKF